MSQFHQLKVKDIKKETAESVSIAFDIPLELANAFQFEAGQYITLRTTVNNEDIRRSYSICSAPYENEIRVGVKQVAQGKMSTFLNQSLHVGDVLSVMPPTGNFIAKNHTTNIIGIAAGSGITPVLSLLKTVLKAGGKFTLFYGNVNEQSAMFKKEIDDLLAKNPSQLTVFYTYDEGKNNGLPEIACGRIDGKKMNAFIREDLAMLKADGFYICGPEPMIKSVDEALKYVGVASQKIHFELFTAPTKTAETSKPTNTSSFKGTSQLTVIMDGEEFNFDLNSDGATILDAAMQQGADAPFSCKGAVCCTCKAQVIEGSAMMDMNYALSDEEVADGFILTCQAHPTSEKVVVDYDVI